MAFNSEIKPQRTGQNIYKIALPERLIKAIRDQQERSEILISVIQLLIVAIFGLLYTISPKTFSDDAAFAPVPWVLSAYLLFSLIRLSLAIKRRLPDWILYLSAIADISCSIRAGVRFRLRTRIRGWLLCAE